MARRDTGPSAGTVQLVRDRDGHSCARCGSPRGLSTHHRRPRGMGGSKGWPGINQPPNLLTLCGHGTTGCHGWVETNRTDALAAGLLVSKFSDPAATPVFTWRGWVRLTEAGDVEHVDLSPPF